MSEWQKDLSAVAFEAADLVQRVRTLVLATGALAELVPDDAMGRAVHKARFELGAAIALIETGAEGLLQLGDEHQVDYIPSEPGEVVHFGPRFSRPGGAPDPADGWPQ